MELPKHKCGLTIEHNPHLNFYESVKQHLANGDFVDLIIWESDEDKQLCYDTNELWAIQWYPDTPVGSYSVAASSLEKVLALALRVEREEKGE